MSYYKTSPMNGLLGLVANFSGAANVGPSGTYSGTSSDSSPSGIVGGFKSFAAAVGTPAGNPSSSSSGSRGSSASSTAQKIIADTVVKMASKWSGRSWPHVATEAARGIVFDQYNREHPGNQGLPPDLASYKTFALTVASRLNAAEIGATTGANGGNLFGSGFSNPGTPGQGGQSFSWIHRNFANASSLAKGKSGIAFNPAGLNVKEYKNQSALPGTSVNLGGGGSGSSKKDDGGGSGRGGFLNFGGGKDEGTADDVNAKSDALKDVNQRIEAAVAAARAEAAAGNKAASDALIAQVQAMQAQQSNLQSQLADALAALKNAQSGGGSSGGGSGYTSGGGGGGGSGYTSGGGGGDIIGSRDSEYMKPPTEAAPPAPASWWSQQSTGMKAAVIGVPAVLLLGLGYMAMRKPAAAAPLKANKGRKSRAKTKKCPTCRATCRSSSASCYRCGDNLRGMKRNGLMMKFGPRRRPLSARQIEHVIDSLPPSFRRNKLASVYQFHEKPRKTSKGRRKMRRNPDWARMKHHAHVAWRYTRAKAKHHGKIVAKKAAKHGARGVAWMLRHGAAAMAHGSRKAHAYSLAPNRRYTTLSFR